MAALTPRRTPRRPPAQGQLIYLNTNIRLPTHLDVARERYLNGRIEVEEFEMLVHGHLILGDLDEGQIRMGGIPSAAPRDPGAAALR